MYATTATCHICNGDGEIEGHVLVWTGGSVPEPSHDEIVQVECQHCKGSGECDCRDCLDTAAENAFSDQCESEPPLSADERHRMAWQQKQELRR